MRPFLLVALLIGIPISSKAENSSAIARQLFQRAQERFDQNRFEEALVDFGQSNALLASPNSRLYMARCLERLGRLVEALDEYERTAGEAAERSKLDPRYEPIREAALLELSAVSQRLGRVRIALSSPPAGLALTLAGRAIPLSAIGLALAVAPGQVEVLASAPGFLPARGHLQVEVGREILWSPVLVQAPAAAVHDAMPPAVTHGADAPAGPARTWAWAALGAGAAGGAGFGVLGLMTRARFRELEARCNSGPCPSSELGAVRAGERLQLAANIALGVGIAGAAAGIVLFMVSRPGARAAAQVSLGPGGACLVGSF